MSNATEKISRSAALKEENAALKAELAALQKSTAIHGPGKALHRVANTARIAAQFGAATSGTQKLRKGDVVLIDGLIQYPQYSMCSMLH